MDELDEIASHEIQTGWDVITADDETLGVVDAVGDVSFTVSSVTGAGNVIEVAFDDVESAAEGSVKLQLSRDDIQTGIDAG